ncbi:MerR family transcriptional regulator [Pseudomonas sp. RIT-PI-AD]|uniref:MerR family transcriptional regulator n=1 Tax=Pseudomonas sp. RIT-PI-AD TaxID=3035294 RepID=UPI0021DAA7AF|nr:MerR family transcriptional regulator [Pseudomonas sp. RIT-PI-AD]
MNESAATARAPGLEQDELFPIREVSRLTGVNPVTLRAWERRYGLIQPTRTDSGHRLYSLADIEAVRSIMDWIERGVAVSKVGTLLARRARPSAEALQPAGVEDRGEWQARIRAALAEFDDLRLERLYGQAFASYTPQVVFQDIFMPVWQEALTHRERFGRTSEWLFLDGFLRARTLQRLQLGRGHGERRVLLVGWPGQCRELELQVAGLLLAGTSLDILPPSFGQPLAELTLVCEKQRPEAVVVFSNHPPTAAFVRQLSRLALSLDRPLALAGEAADLAAGSLDGSAVAVLGSEGGLMQRRLLQFLAGHLDT